MRTLLAFFGLLTQALAFNSIAYLPPCEWGSISNQIFVGTLTEKGAGSGPCVLRIDEVLKGVKPGTGEIEVGPGPCGLRYETGLSYLILVYPVEGERTVATFGDPAERFAASIDFFRALARGERLTMVEGRIAENVENSGVEYELDENHRPGLSGVEVTASKDGQTYTSSTGPSGSYQLRVPEAGTYRITSKLREHATTNPSYEVDVAPNSCKELDLGMWTASRVTGHLIGADRKPAAQITVALKSVPDDGNFSAEATTDTSGKFELNNIPPGDYLLGVNMDGFDSTLPYGTRFYPGVADQAKATVVKVSGAKTIEGLDFQIGERKTTRRIEVVVEWPDGRPVINASVKCLSRSSDPHVPLDSISRYVDMQGEATCEVLAEKPFEVHVDRLSWAASVRPVQPVATRTKLIVRAGTDTVRLKFSIDPINDTSAREAPVNMSAYNDTDY